MMRFRVATDIDECREIWRKMVPGDVIWDLWEARECFHRNYQRPLHFVVAEDETTLCGLLPLCWIEESACYGYFPGETWHGKTWLEQNRIIASNGTLPLLLAQCPSPHHVRYLLPCSDAGVPSGAVDEVGYLFLPPRYDYDVEKYYLEFSRKSAKRLARDIEAIESLGVKYRYDDMSDFEHVVALNIARFGQDSYFYDSRFTESFRAMMNYLAENGMLRITAIFIGDAPAAVPDAWSCDSPPAWTASMSITVTPGGALNTNCSSAIGSSILTPSVRVVVATLPSFP